MSATYINNGGALLQIAGTITPAEINALGTTPYIFTTPQNFMPLAFAITYISGTTTPIFSSVLEIRTITNNRVIFIGTDPQNMNFYMFYGYPNGALASQAINIEILANNYQLTPLNGLDPTPGNFTYKYNLIGTILY